MSKVLRCYRDFSGGLSEVANDNMEDNQLSRAVNIVPGEGFGICRSFGTEIALPRLDNSSQEQWLQKLIHLTLEDGTTQCLAFSRKAAGGQALYRYLEESGEWSCVSAETELLRDFFIHGHKLYWLSGKAISCYDGSRIFSPERPESMSEEEWARLCSAVAVEQRGQRWFYAGEGNVLLFSEIGEPFRIGSSSLINVNTKNDDRITALHEFGGGLLIFKQHSVHYLSGWDLDGGSDVQLMQLSVTSGTRWASTVCTLENGVYYLGENGLYRLYVPSNSSMVAAENISENKISEALFSFGPLKNAFAVVWENCYFLSVESGEGLLREYRYYPRLKAFFGEFTQGALSYSLYQGKLYLGIPRGHILCYDKESRHYISPDTGGIMAIPILAVSKGFDVANAMVREIRLRKVVAVARQYKEEQSHFRVQVKADYQESAYQVGTVDLDESLVYGEGSFGQVYWGWEDTVTKELPIRGKTKRLWFFISDEHVDEPLLIYGLGLVFRKRKARGSHLGVSMSQLQYME
ncbi:MAG: hypothetical protein Q4B50_02960 [Bacillota bacterium]|nr:hypothetical protein [Bacillota bacterium]